MIIIAVLGVIAIMLYQVLSLNLDAIHTANFYAGLRSKQTAYYIGRSGMDIARQALSQDDAKVDSLQDFWASQLATIPLDEGTIKITMVDEERYFNPNSLIKSDGTLEKKHYEQFRRLLKLLLIDQDKANLVVDWIDPDINPTLPGGGETGDKPIKNAPLDSINELLYIPGIEKEDYLGKESGGKFFTGLKDNLSIYSNGKINLNTASLDLIRSLDDEITESMAQEIVDRRKDKPFEELEDLLNIPGFTRELIYRITYLADIKSSNFRILCQIKIGDSTTQVTGVINREESGSRLKYIKIE